MTFLPALSLALAMAGADLDGLLLRVKIEPVGRGAGLNAPQADLEKNLSSRFRGEGAELLFPGSDSSASQGGDLRFRLQEHSRNLMAGYYVCKLSVQVLAGSCYQKQFQVSNQGLNGKEALRGLHLQLIESLLSDERFKDCLRAKGLSAEKAPARGIFGQGARHLWKSSTGLWGGVPAPLAGVLVSRPNKRKQFVPALQASRRLAEALGQVFDRAQASFVSGDELTGFLRRSNTTSLALISALTKGSALPRLEGLDYLVHGKLQPGPLGYRLEIRVLNAKSGSLAATATGCCDSEDGLPSEPMMEAVGFEVIPGR